MGTITVNVQDRTIQRFRKTVAAEWGIVKGTLGRAVDEALCKWIAEKQQDAIAKRQLGLMEKGFHMGKLGKLKREDLYDRSL